jgi:hypothetical protein
MRLSSFVWASLVSASLVSLATYGATYSTVRAPVVPPSMLQLSVTRSPPACPDDSRSCWSTSPAVRSLVVAPGQPFWLGLDCEQPPLHAVVRLPFLYIPTTELARDDDCRMAELTIALPPESTVTIDFDGHRSTLDLPIGTWTPLQFIDAEPAAYMRIEPAQPLN